MNRPTPTGDPQSSHPQSSHRLARDESTQLEEPSPAEVAEAVSDKSVPTAPSEQDIVFLAEPAVAPLSETQQPMIIGEVVERDVKSDRAADMVIRDEAVADEVVDSEVVDSEVGSEEVAGEVTEGKVDVEDADDAAESEAKAVAEIRPEDVVQLQPVVEPPDAPPMVYLGDTAEPPVRVVDAKPAPPEPKPGFLVRCFLFVGGCAEWCFGVVSLMIGLAIVASIPILQFASLGYLLEASGRVARSGRIRDAFMGVRPAARIGGLVLGAWLVYSPLLLINEMWYSAYLIDPTSGITGAWRIAQLVATILIVLHVVVAWFNGGRLRDYFWPLAAPFAVPWNLYQGRGLVISIPPLRILTEIGQGSMLARRRDAVWEFLAGLQLPHLFWLGLRGFAGAVAWLVVPIMMLATAGFLPAGGAVLFSLLGAALLTIVLLYLPFLQAQFAMKGEMVAMFDLPAVRDKFRRAPIAFWFALLITLLFAVPLYLLKIELTPQETLWIPSLVFVAFMFPARVLTGWVLGLASKRERPRHFIFRFFSRIAQVPIVMAYVGIVYLTQYLSWYGVWSLFEQHAFLTPAPFLGG